VPAATIIQDRIILGGLPRIANLAGRWTVNLYDLYWRFYIHDRPGAGIASPRRLPIEPGVIYLIPPHSPFATYQTGEQIQLFAHFQLGPHCPLLESGLYRCDRDSALTAAAVALLEELRTGSTDPWLAVRMLHLISGALPQLPRDHFLRSVSDPRVTATIDHVYRHLDVPIDVAAYARMQGLCRTAFIRIFRTETGATPLQYLLGLKIDIARRRLEDGDDDLGRLSRDLGFVDRSHFTRVFKALSGTTPAAYRRSFRAWRTG